MIQKIWILFLILAILFNAFANIVIKVGMIEQKTIFDKGVISALITIISNPYAIAGIFSFGIAFILYSGVLSTMDLSVAYPIMTGTGFLIVLIASIFLFKETVTIFRLLGIISIIGGITLISLKG